MGPIIFEKNKIDLDYSNVTITASDSTPGADAGQDFVNLLRNRKNDSGWGTGGSSDAGNSTLEVMFGEPHEITDILLIQCNFDSYSIVYYDGSSWLAFPTAIAVTGNTDTDRHHSFSQVLAEGVRLVVTGTITPDQDKLLAQFIITKRMGQFATQPLIRSPKHSRGRKVKAMLSGRANVTRALGAFSCGLVFPAMKNASDHALIESMFDSFNGFLVWLCGGTSTQFFADVQGFRKRDLYLMACANDLEVEWKDGHYAHGQSISINLVESRI